MTGFLGAQGIHNGNHEVRSILAFIQYIVSFDRGLNIIIERGVIQFLPRSVDLIQHLILHIITRLLEPFDLLSKAQRFSDVFPCNAEEFTKHTELFQSNLDELHLSLSYSILNFSRFSERMFSHSSQLS